MRKNIIIILCILSLFAGASITGADEATPVIGECTIKKGTKIEEAIYIDPARGPYNFSPKAFKDQKVYIFRKLKEGFYIADGTNFSHDCPVHGEEILSKEGYLKIRYDTPTAGIECREF